MTLSKDAISFGIGFLNGPRSYLSFGGDGAYNRITERGRAALNELLAEGYAEAAKARDCIPNREHYKGVAKQPNLWELARAARMHPFADTGWPAFEPVCMAKGTWRGAFPAAKLPQTLEFYRGLRDRRGGAYARFYVEDVAALEAVEKELKCPKT